MSATLLARATRPVTPDDYLRGIDALLPTIRSRAGEVERNGMIPPDLIRLLTDAHVFRAVQPWQWGGLELDLGTFFESAVRIASACGSTGWVASVVGVHPWHVAMFDNRAQADVWADNPDERASTSYAPTGTVVRAPGGFRLSGRWGFSSGVDHCGWVILGAVIPDDSSDGEGPEYRSFLVPRADFAIDHDSWRVTGLSGTGSKDVVLDGAFVPDYRTHTSTHVHERSDPGLAVNDRPLFRLPWSVVFPYAIASPAIGAATGAVGRFIENNRARVSIAGNRTVSASPGLHLRLAEALTEVEAMRTRLRQTWAEFHVLADRGEEIPMLRRAQCRYEVAHALAHAAGTVFRLLEINGASTVRVDEPFQRLFRDLCAMRNHISATLGVNASLYAQMTLGAPPPPFNRALRVAL